MWICCINLGNRCALMPMRERESREEPEPPSLALSQGLACRKSRKEMSWIYTYSSENYRIRRVVSTPNQFLATAIFVFRDRETACWQFSIIALLWPTCPVVGLSFLVHLPRFICACKKGFCFSYVKAATLLFPCSFFSCYEEKSVYS